METKKDIEKFTKKMVAELKRKDFEVKIKYSLLNKIAEYYQVPIVAFFVEEKEYDRLLSVGTRNNAILKMLAEFKQEIRTVLEKYE